MLAIRSGGDILSCLTAIPFIIMREELNGGTFEMAQAMAFFKGNIVPIEQANVSVMTHALHYGTAVFEGVRGNWNADQNKICLLYTSPSPRDLSTSRMPSSA